LPHAAFTQFADELKPLCKELSFGETCGPNPAAICTKFVRRRRLQKFGTKVVADRKQ
jgi:hypothetical protein